MSYRGDDLDLRTQTAVGASDAFETSAGNGQRAGSRGGPVFVDDTVLGLANHAYDIALAHRAGEVRLEHLLHALTRHEAAADLLEARGVRVAALRRDCVTIIANDIPIGLPNGKGSPRRSDEFAEIMRLAAVLGSRRNAPADLDDLVQALLDARGEYASLSLLTRNANRSTYRDYAEPLPPLMRQTPEPRYSNYANERAPRQPVERQPAERPIGPRADYTQADVNQNNRIDTLETMLRQLSGDLASERQVVATLLKDLSRDTQGQRDDHGRWQSGLHDRLQTLEAMVTDVRRAGFDTPSVDGLSLIEGTIDRRFVEMTEAWNALSSRLQDLEIAIRQSPAAKGDGFSPDRLRQIIDLQPVINRLDIIEEAVLTRDGSSDNRIADRLQSLEDELARALTGGDEQVRRIETLVSGMADRGGVEGASGSVLDLAAGIETHRTTIVERLEAVERVVMAEIETAAAKHQAYAKDLNEVHEAIMKLNQNQHTLAGAIDQWRTDAAGDVAMISNKLASLDVDNDAPLATLNALGANMDKMNRLMIERYHRRNRFWYWLFGTDDWIGSSWPSQAAAVEADDRRLKAAVRT